MAVSGGLAANSIDDGYGGVGKRRFLLIFFALILAMFVSSLSETIAATALPTIAGDLKGVQIMQWVSTSYILTSSITMPVYGKLGDMFGRKRLLMAALILYAIGKVLCGIAPNMSVLITGRCISGLGGGGIPILAQAAMADLVPPRKLGAYLGMMGATLTISLVIGPILGGWFVQVTGWRFIFWFTVPLALLSVVPIGLFLPKPNKSFDKKRVDYAGIIFLAAATTSLVMISAASGMGGLKTGPIATVSTIATLIFAALFIFSENHAQEPIIPMDLFRDKNFTLCSMTGLLLHVGLVGVVTYMPTYFQIVNRMSPTLSGLMFAPMAIMVFFMSTLSGVISSKTGKYKWMTLVMCVVAAFGFYLLSTFKPSQPVFISVFYMIILGAGLGIGMQMLLLVVQNEFPHSVVGTATGATRFCDQIGATLGASLVGTMFTSRLTADLAGKLPKADNMTIATITPQLVDKLPQQVQNTIAQAYAEALVPLFIIFVPVTLVCFVLMLFLKRNKLATTVDHGGAQG